MDNLQYLCILDTTIPGGVQYYWHSTSYVWYRLY